MWKICDYYKYKTNTPILKEMKKNYIILDDEKILYKKPYCYIINIKFFCVTQEEIIFDNIIINDITASIYLINEIKTEIDKKYETFIKKFIIIDSIKKKLIENNGFEIEFKIKFNITSFQLKNTKFKLKIEINNDKNQQKISDLVSSPFFIKSKKSIINPFKQKKQRNFSKLKKKEYKFINFDIEKIEFKKKFSENLMKIYSTEKIDINI